MFKTEKQARDYAERLTGLGKTHLVFKVPKGTQAFVSGMRYATCDVSERAEYEKGGAVFLADAEQPSAEHLESVRENRHPGTRAATLAEVEGALSKLLVGRERSPGLNDALALVRAMQAGQERQG